MKSQMLQQIANSLAFVDIVFLDFLEECVLLEVLLEHGYAFLSPIRWLTPQNGLHNLFLLLFVIREDIILVQVDLAC